MLGTYGYMSPEQLCGRAVDERTDLFAIGVIVVETLSGRRPFRGDTFPALLRSVLEDEWHFQGEGDAIRHLDAVVQRCLAKDPANRVGSAGALRAELVPALRDCPPIRPSRDPSCAQDAPTVSR